MITQMLKVLDKELEEIQQSLGYLLENEPEEHYKIAVCEDKMKTKYREFRDEYERDGSVLLNYPNFASIYGRNGKFGIVRYEERARRAFYDIEQLGMKPRNYGSVERIMLLVDAIFSIYGMEKRQALWLRREGCTLRFAVPRKTLDGIRESSKKILEESTEKFLNSSADKPSAQGVIDSIYKFLESPKTFTKKGGVFEAYKNYYNATKTKD